MGEIVARPEAVRVALSERETLGVLALVDRLSGSGALALETLIGHSEFESIRKRKRVADPAGVRRRFWARQLKLMSADSPEGPALIRMSSKHGKFSIEGLTDEGASKLESQRQVAGDVHGRRLVDEVSARQLVACLRLLEDNYERARLLLKPGPIPARAVESMFPKETIPNVFRPLDSSSALWYEPSGQYFTHRRSRTTTRMIVGCPRCNAPMLWGLAGGALHCNSCGLTADAGDFHRRSGRHAWFVCPKCGSVGRLHHKGRVGITSALRCSNNACGAFIWNSEEALMHTRAVPDGRSYLCRDFAYRYFAVPNAFEEALFAFRKRLGCAWWRRYPGLDVIDWAVLDNNGVLELADAKRWRQPERLTEEEVISFEAKAHKVAEDLKREGIASRAERRVLIVLRLPAPTVCNFARNLGVSIISAHQYLSGFLT